MHPHRQVAELDGSQGEGGMTARIGGAPAWRSFKDNPPYDWRESVDGHIESDPDWGFIAYVYANRYKSPFNYPQPHRVWFSSHPYPFKDGAFTGFRSHMITSPYPEDRIEVIAWLPIQALENYLETTFPASDFGCSLL